MIVAHGLESLPALSAAVVTVGNFDGVHVAHREILAAVTAEARRRGATAVAVSFEPHPNRILRPQAAAPRITPPEEKIRQLATTGIDVLLLLPFTRDLSLLTPYEFVGQILMDGLHAVAVHEGANFRFGHRHAGDIGELQRLGREMGFAVTVHEALRARGEIVSSTRVREMIAAGEVGKARPLLGRVFSVRGMVARGRGVGRARTVPTLNLQTYEELLPGRGVYVTRTKLGEFVHNSLTNIGVRPTFGESETVTVETFILDPPADGLEAEIGMTIEIGFLHRIRDEQKFATPEALRERIMADAEAGERFFRCWARAKNVGSRQSVVGGQR